MQPQSFLASLISSAIWKVVQYAASFVKHIIIAAAIGLSAQLDIFYMAMAFIGVLIFTWSQALEFAAMPQLVKAAARDNARRFGNIAGGVFTVSVYAGVVIGCFLLLFRDALSGFANGLDDVQRLALADAFAWLIPVILLSVPFGVFGAVLRAKRLFSRFYEAQALLAIAILVCIVIAPSHPHVLLWSMSVGVTAGFAYAGVFAARHIRITVNPFAGELAKLLRPIPALMLLYGTYSILVIVDRMFASYLATGSISAIAYALVIVQIIPGLLGIGQSFMTVAAEKDSRRKRSRTINDLFSLVIFLSAGGTAFMVLAGSEIVALLFERGAFSATDTGAVATALTAFAFMVAPGFLLAPLDQIYQVEGRIGMMVWRTVIGIILAGALNYLAVFVLGWGVFGIALGTTISFWVIVLLAIFGLVGIGYDMAPVRHLKWIVWCALLASAGGAAFVLLPDMGHFMNVCAAAVCIGVAMALAGLFYRGKDETQLIKQVMMRLARMPQAES